MRAGELRHRVDVQRAVERRTDGATVISWEDEYLSVPASVEPLIGREVTQAQAVSERVTVRVRMRYLPITSRHRLVMGRRGFNILSAINPDERMRETVCLCEEVSL